MADSRTSHRQIHASTGHELAVMFGFIAAMLGIQSPSFNDHITICTYFVPAYYSNLYLCLVDSCLWIELLRNPPRQMLFCQHQQITKFRRK